MCDSGVTVSINYKGIQPTCGRHAEIGLGSRSIPTCTKPRHFAVLCHSMEHHTESNVSLQRSNPVLIKEMQVRVVCLDRAPCVIQAR